MSERDLFFANITKFSPKTKDTLKWLLDEYPSLICIPNEFELHYQRAALVQQLADEKQPLNMTAFERGLKHMGLKCVQTTHKEYVKVWKQTR